MEEAVDLEFARQLPKIELHAHLNGSVSRECLHDIWLAKKVHEPDLDLEDPLVFLPTDTENVKTKDFLQFENYINGLVNTVHAIRDSTRDVLKTFEADNVRYLELRVTPREIHGYSCISKKKYVEIVLCAIDDHQIVEAHKMRVKLILSIDRGETTQEAFETLEIALQFQERGVVGLDLCGSPLHSNVTGFESAFVEARLSTLGTTLHFANTKAVSEDSELKLLLGLHPDRLSHVIWVNPESIDKIIDHGIGLELCLSSDVHSELKGHYAHHPFGDWRKGYKSFALCTGDHANVFQTSLSHEYYLAAKHFGLSRAEVVDIAENAVSLIFEEPKSHDKSRLPTYLAKKELRDMLQDFRDEHLSLQELAEHLRLKEFHATVAPSDITDLASLEIGDSHSNYGREEESMGDSGMEEDEGRGRKRMRDEDGR